jgi:hypothetical protein
MWVAKTSDLVVHESLDWTWGKLLDYCSKQNLKVTELLIEFSGTVVILPKNADGYWQAKSVFSVQGNPDVLHEGIGYVENNLLHITWLSFYNHKVVVEYETRSPFAEKQVIWANKIVNQPLGAW